MCSRRHKLMGFGRHAVAIGAVILTMSAGTSSTRAGTPIALRDSIAGPVDFAGTGASLRAASNAVDPCAVVSAASARLDGLPAGSTVRDAWLYWAGSYSIASGSTRTAPDYDVTFAGRPVAADRRYTETFAFGDTDYDFFSGVADVTAVVAASRNATYTLSGLDVNTAGPHCGVQAVVAGWVLLVVWEHPAEPVRVVNLYEGFRYYRGGSITLTPSNFVIPPSPVDGKHGHVSFEGDETNSGSLGGFTEQLRFEGQVLTDASNPPDNQFNSTVNVADPPDAGSWGVDFDAYDISAFLRPGMTTATSEFAAGADLVLLSAEVVSVTNLPVADLAIDKSHSGNFRVGEDGVYAIAVGNQGPAEDPGPIRVDDTLPAGLDFVGWSGSGWNCGSSGSTVSCTHPGPLPAGRGLPNLLLTVRPDASASSTVVNTARVAGAHFDNDTDDNTASDPTVVERAVPTAGNKPLYLHTAGGPRLDRLPGATTEPVQNVDHNGSFNWTMTPAAQSRLVIDGDGGSIPVALWLRKGGGSASRVQRDLRLTLSSAGPASGLPVGLTSRVQLSGTPEEFVFEIPVSGDVTLAPGSALILEIANVTAGNGNRRVRVYPATADGTSRVLLTSETVIELASVDLLDAAWPDGSLVTSASPGDRVWVRALASDPFGSYDITAAALDLLDPAGAPVLTAQPMSVVADSGQATRTFERAVDVPPGAASGDWTVRVTADEGTEGRVRDTRTATLSVVTPPRLTILKSASVSAAAPGEPVLYSVQVTNTTPHAATGVTLDDALSRHVAFGLETFAPGQPFLLIQGDSPSGLSLGRPRFSADGGATYDYVPVSGGGGAPPGFDANVTHWRLPLVGTMGGPGTSFTLRYGVGIR